MITINQYRMPLVALLFFLSGPAISANCGEVSPRLLELGDQYYEPVTMARPLTEPAGDGPMLATLEQLLGETFRTGSGSRVVCLGTGERARSVISHFELNDIQQGNALNGEYRFTALEEVHAVLADADERIDGIGSIHLIRLSLPPVESWIQDASGMGISSVTANRRQSARNASLLQERIWMAIPSSNGVDLEVHDYTNGVHGGSMLWRLRSS